MTNASGSAKSRFPYVRKRNEKNGEAMKARALLAASSAAAALLLAPGLAHADTYGSLGDHSSTAYGKELADVGFTDPTGQPAGLASTVCDIRSGGDSESTVIAMMQGNQTARTATVIVLGAEFHFGPAYATTYNIAKNGR
jgi:hypothetical protein